MLYGKKINCLLKHEWHEKIITKIRIPGADVAGEALAKFFNVIFFKICTKCVPNECLQICVQRFRLPIFIPNR